MGQPHGRVPRNKYREPAAREAIRLAHREALASKVTQQQLGDAIGVADGTIASRLSTASPPNGGLSVFVVGKTMENG